jgi:hypothetical protein
MKALLTLTTVACLFLSVFSSAFATMGFENIRKESTYWLPYEIGDGVMVVINCPMAQLNVAETQELAKAFAFCREEKNPPPYKYYWVDKGRMEGIVTKNWPELYRAKYPADVNEIMLDARKKAIQKTNPRLTYW